MNNDHLMSKCEPNCRDPRCVEMVKQAPSGRFFVTMFHAGFNTTANNRDGYGSKEQAVSVVLRHLAKGGR